MSMQNQHSKRPKCALGHTRLEPRRLLNADFDLTGGTLELDGFVDSTVDPNEVTLSQTGLVYSFELADGFWTGDDSAAGVTLLAGDSILEIDTSQLANTFSTALNTRKRAPFENRPETKWIDQRPLAPSRKASAALGHVSLYDSSPEPASLL